MAIPTRFSRLLALLALPFAANLAAAKEFIVKDGKPNAEIVIAKKPGDDKGKTYHLSDVVTGEKQTKENPWFFNIGRVRQRHGAKKQCLMFSPIGKMAYHVPEKFAKLVTK